MATTYFEEMLTDSTGEKRNFEIITHSNLLSINIGEPNIEGDVNIQFVLNEKQYFRLLNGLRDAGGYLAWKEL